MKAISLLGIGFHGHIILREEVYEELYLFFFLSIGTIEGGFKGRDPIRIERSIVEL